MVELYLFYVRCVLLLCSLCAGISQNVPWTLCLEKCYFLSRATVKFTDVDTYCKSLSQNAGTVDFGTKNNDSMAMVLGSCRLNKREGESYWVNMKFSISTRCRTIRFIGNHLFENQDVDCSMLAHPFCETDKSLGQHLETQNKTSNNEWVTIDNKLLYYHISTGIYSYCEAVEYCSNMQTQISNIDHQNYALLTSLATALRYKIGQNFEIWIYASGVSCPAKTTLNAITISYVGPVVHVSRNKSVLKQVHALCDSPFISTTTTTTTTLTGTSTTAIPTTTTIRPTPISTTITPITTKTRFPKNKRWIHIGQEEYFVNYNVSTYENAKAHCLDEHATLLTFPNTISYFGTLRKMFLSNGSYWIDGLVEYDGQSNSRCMSYTQDSHTLSSSECKFPKYSICSRSLNVTDQQVLNDPVFKIMIKEMTVEKNTTNKSIRKLICVQDNRRSAQAAGGFSVFIIGAMIALLVLSDLTNFMTYLNKKL